MAKKALDKGGVEDAPERESYPVVEIDRSFSAEASRRNIEIIVWYKRLINTTLGLLVSSVIFTLIAVLFAWSLPLPKVYGTSMDGALRPIEYVRTPTDPKLGAMRGSLSAEDASRRELLPKPRIESLVGAQPASRPLGAPSASPALPALVPSPSAVLPAPAPPRQ